MFERCRRMPSLVVGAVLTLAVSVGLNVAVFGLMDRALLSPPAHVADPARVFTLGFGTSPDDDAHGTMSSTSYVAFNALRKSVPAISEVATFQENSVYPDARRRSAKRDLHAKIGAALRMARID